MSINGSKISQNLIDKYPFRKYTYSSLKHILEIGFKVHHCGGINLKNRICFLISIGWPT